MLEARLHQAHQRQRRQHPAATGERLRVLVGMAEKKCARRDGRQPAERIGEGGQRRRAFAGDDSRERRPQPARRLRRRDQQHQPEQPQRGPQRRKAAFLGFHSD
ncbi:MAG: hypothetical protein E6J88_15535 [Deltaproteobacteria bacterium]|nr:MAG: hypothetical protein E6J88_15535 [Deltaproteobacteria bacterium]